MIPPARAWESWLDPPPVAIARRCCRQKNPELIVLSLQPNPSSQAASLLAAGVIALQATPAMALNAIELQDQRQTNKNGLQLIYEVRARPIYPDPRRSDVIAPRCRQFVCAPPSKSAPLQR
jgi:hypothetical protein